MIRECLSACFKALAARGIDALSAVRLFVGVGDVPEVLRRVEQAVNAHNSPHTAAPGGLAIDPAAVGKLSEAFATQANEDFDKLKGEVTGCLDTLAQHGYLPSAVGVLFQGAAESKLALEHASAKGRERGEFVG
mmetsp:Transcript_8686/g.22334  ORF Transcript_8686/g.22334 Transcript_8686/m.22334 type:complete len:134 (-) Transcript_8686:69-470(-)